MPKTDKEKKAKKTKRKDKTMLDRGLELNAKKLLADNKTLLEVYKDIQKRQQKEEDMFEEKLRKLREQTYQVIKETEEETAKAYADKYLTKNQTKSQIIGAKEYVRDEAPDKLKVYTHYARKYGIPFVQDKHKKTLEQLVRDIHTYEMQHRDEIIRGRQLDPITKTYGLYIV